MEEKSVSITTKVFVSIEEFILLHFTPRNNPGPVLKWLFKIPILFYKMGLPIFSKYVMLLTTIGRKSGKPRYTPLEYRRDRKTGQIIITAGWSGNTDWRKNIVNNPSVEVSIGKQKYAAIAKALTESEVAEIINEAIKINPSSKRMWSKLSDKSIDLDSPEGLLIAAKYFPSYRLLPTK